MSDFPIRCFCNKVIGHLLGKWLRLIREDQMTPGDALTQLGIPPKRFCCRRMFLGYRIPIDHINMMDDREGFNKLNHITFDNTQCKTARLYDAR